MSSVDRREPLIKLSETVVIDPASGSEIRSSSSVEPRERLVVKDTPSGTINTLAVPFSPTDFECIERTTEVTVTGIRRTEPPTVMERLRVDNPNRNILSVAVEQLDQPGDMARFLIEYAHEVGETSEAPGARAHPFDIAVESINRMATLHGGEIASRWYELLDTGTVKNPPIPLPPFLVKRG